jgi:phage shock protein PspC (stress-responsive transcriptional regulator)
MTTRTDSNPTPPLRRSREDRVVAGVAAGVARRVELPTWVIRVAFVILAIFGGFGLALYLAGWLLIPEDGSDEPIVKALFDRVHGATGWIGVALIGLAVLVVIDATGFLRGDLTLAAILIVVGVLLYRGDLGRRRTPGPAATDRDGSEGSSPVEASSVTPPGTSDDVTAATDAAGAAFAAPPAPPPPPPPAPRPPRPRSPLGRITFALALVAVGGMWLADTSMASFDPTPRHYLGVVVGVIGLGLLVGSWAGRARGLIVLGVFLTPLLLVAPLIDGGMPASVGDRYYSATTAAELAPRYELGAGQLVLDLRDLRLEGGQADLDVFLGFGDLEIRVPDDLRVEVGARVGAGDITIGDVERSGIGRDARVTLPGDEGVLRIDVEMNIGQVDVTRGGVRADRSLSDVFGDRTIVVDTEQELLPRYDLATGTLVLDLSGVRLTAPRTVEVTVGTGVLRVVTPSGGSVDVDASVAVGTMDLFGNRQDGIGLDGSYGSTGDTPTLRLELDLVRGDLIVEDIS